VPLAETHDHNSPVKVIAAIKNGEESYARRKHLFCAHSGIALRVFLFVACRKTQGSTQHSSEEGGSFEPVALARTDAVRVDVGLSLNVLSLLTCGLCAVMCVCSVQAGPQNRSGPES
jgi:hypothetical protein